MLKLRLFTVYDTKAETYYPPFCAGHVAEALRIFSDLLSDPQSKLSKHPEDYRLFAVGHYDSLTGIVSSMDPAGIQLIEEGLELVKASA